MKRSNPKKNASKIAYSIYDESNPRESDLISEAGGNEFFLIEGDSLLLDILKAPHRRIDWTHSGQFLHLLAALEQFLKQILIAGGKFAIIFFDCNRSLWDPSVQCFRCILIHHLTHKTDLEVYCLPSWIPDVDPRFAQEFMETLPAFVALSDAEYATNPTMVNQFRAFFAFCRQTLNTCFISSIRPRSGRLIGLVCGPLKRPCDWSAFNLDSEEAPVRSEWMQPTDQQWLDSITTLACIGVINASNAENIPRDLELCKVMLIHASLIPRLPLEQRALNVKIDEGNEIVQSFLHRYFSTLNSILECYNFESDTASVDIFDGRLFSSLLVFFATHDNLEPTDILTDAEFTRLTNVWAQITSPGSPVVARIDFVKGECIAPAQLVANNLMITCQSVVKSIVLPDPIGIEGGVFQPPRRVVEFSEAHHWHSNKPLVDPLWKLAKNDDPVQAKDLKQQRRENRSLQKYYHFINQ